MAQARPLLEFKLRQTLARLPLDTPEARSRAVAAAVEVLGWQPDPIARHEYTFMAAQLIGVDAEAIQRAVAEAGGPRRPDAAAAAADRRLPGHVKVEREALRLLLSRGGDSRGWARELTEADFTAPARRELFRIALASMGGDEGQAQERLAEAVDDLSPEGRSLMTELMLADDGGELGGRVEEIFVRLKVFGLERDIKRRRKTLQEINPLEDPQRHDALFTELVGLEARRRDLLRQLQGAA